MPLLTESDVRAHLDTLAAPAGGFGELARVAVRLCVIQQTLAPVAWPRRLVLFAADHGLPSENEVGPTFRAVISGGSATAVLAKATSTDLVLVDVGTRADPRPDAPNYRCRKVRAGQAALTADEFRAAFIVGQNEAERAAKDGMKVVATDGLGAVSDAAARVTALLREMGEPDDDAIPALAAVVGADLAAAAGFIAKAAELAITVLLDGAFAVAAALVAERLYPGTMARTCGEGSSSSEGFDALLAFPTLEAAAAIVAHTAQREAAPARMPAVPKPPRKIAVFTGSFDPPTTYHRRVAKLLRGRGFDEVIVRPTGPRCEDPDNEHAVPIHRAVMADLAFRDLPGVSVDLADLDDAAFTPNLAFDELYADRGEVWHVVSAEFVAGGRSGESAVQMKWEAGDELWRGGRFVVLHASDAPPDAADLPPRCQLVPADGHVPTADIRLRIFQGGEARPDVPGAVEEYLRRYRLFSGAPAPRETCVRLRDVRLKVVCDELNPKARELAVRFRLLETTDPTHVLVLGGDGTMLQAIRDHWRLRLPFIGLNAGTLGFLMNESLPAELPGTEVLVYRMPMLRVDAELPDRRRRKSLGYADAWLERDSGQAAWLRVDVDGRTQVPKVVGDGLLVATPSGSSAYARAMGATPVPLSAPVLTLAGSNVFRPRFWKPVALPESAVVTLTSVDRTGKRPVRGFIDGHPIGLVRSLEVRVSSVAAVELAFTPEFDLSARLLRSMFPPSEGM